MDDLKDTQYNLPIGTDAISRQAALVAVKDALMAWPYMSEWRGEKILEAIAELPSAQPEIVRCKDCKYHYKGICPIERYFSLDGFCSRGER